ncbi:MAG: GcrA family cell cycle regulator [Pseudomonadota bacterium]
MSWTDERVARLSKLWAEGLSASQIAADLGGVTRNAVIGKVHRLGLSGRAKPANPSISRPKRKATTRSYSSRTTRTTTRTVGATALKVEVDAVAEFEHKPAEDVVVPMSKRLKLLELNESTCKWPTGDPQNTDFHFCGHQTKEGKPYCEYHSKIAFQPPSDRRRR